MKKLMIFAFMLIAMTANAAVENVENDSTITSNGIKIANGSDEDDTWSMHFNIGVNIPTNTQGVDFAPFRSWEIGWTVA